MVKAVSVRFRVDFPNHCSVGVGKVQLLEGIARSGSISQAARDLHMSYRRAWLLVEDLKSSFDTPVVASSTGGPGGGGATLTAFGATLVAQYRELESQLQPLANAIWHEVAANVKKSAGKRKLGTTSIKGKIIDA
jgi:molybdate transport system regulatory protein